MLFVGTNKSYLLNFATYEPSHPDKHAVNYFVIAGGEGEVARMRKED